LEALNIKKIIKGICFVIIFAVLFLFCQKILQAKWVANSGDTCASTSDWKEYRSLEENSIDVLFIGTSHSYSAIDPMYMYGQSGLTSYVLGGPGLRLDLTYMVLQDALKTQSPSVVFLDMSAIQYEDQQEETKSHKISDQLPMSLSKLEYAFNNENDEMKPLDVLFPLFRYHTRWESLEEDDFKYVTDDLPLTYVRGHYITYKTKATDLFFEDEYDFTLTERNKDYFNRIVELCKDENIELITYKIPTPEWYEANSEAAQKLADEAGVTYMELYYDVDEIGLDVTEDFRDKKDHLNQKGAEKVSQYMLNYILDNYSFQDQRNSNERWDSDYEKYAELVQSQYEKYYN
jgi:hypothetical protein